ncbi:MAG: dockerin type I repeat-containing protein [candidate division Zixibacteria bacterium]|nr:dockerin type I repeat-containing protein [candidate division Zixibacteria bacterium]
MINLVPAFGQTCGDINGDGNINIGDALYLIVYISKGGPAPNPMAAGDLNCDEAISIGDAVYLIAYIFRGGPAPCCK